MIEMLHKFNENITLFINLKYKLSIILLGISVNLISVIYHSFILFCDWIINYFK